MRAGTWGHEAVQPVTARATIGAQTRPVEATVESSLYDAHPAHPSTSPSSTGSLRVGPARPVTRLAPDPVTRPSGWPPVPGTTAVVDVGDGVQWFRQLTGEVDEVDGAITDPGVGVDVVDGTDRLDTLMTSLDSRASDAYLETQPPVDGWRRVGLSSTWLVDRAARAAGYFASAPVVWETRLAVPMMGSIIPDVGTVTRAARASNPLTTPGALTSPWGLAAYDVDAAYTLSTPTGAGSWVEATIDLPTKRATGQARVWLLDDTAGRYGFRFGYDHAADTVFVGTWSQAPSATATTTTYSVPRNGASRVTVRVRSTGGDQTMRLRLDNSETVHTWTETGALATGWAAHRVEITAPETSIGGVTVADAPPQWATLTPPRTARVRVQGMSWWTSSRPTTGMTVKEVLDAIADAECASWWIDSAGVLQWAGRGVLEAQPVAATITTELGLIDLPWTLPRRSTAQRVRLKWLTNTISRRADRSVHLWAASGVSGLVGGDTWEEIAASPDDEDWLGTDPGVKVLGPDSALADARDGTVAASELVNRATDGVAWGNLPTAFTLEQISQQAWKWTATVTAQAGHEVNLRVPDHDTVASNLPRYYRGKDFPRLRGYARVKWAERRDGSPTATDVTTGRYEYEHDCGWYVQEATQRSDLRTYLRTELARRLPVLPDVPVRPDPRIEVGDKLVLTDPDRTGLSLTVLVQSVTSMWRDGDASMSLRCRVLSHTKAAVTDLPALHWLQDQPDGARAV